MAKSLNSMGGFSGKPCVIEGIIVRALLGCHDLSGKSWEYIGKYETYWEMIGNIRNGPLIDDVIVTLRVIFHGKLRASRPASGPSLVLSCCLLIWLVVQLPKNMCQEASSQLEHKNKV